MTNHYVYGEHRHSRTVHLIHFHDAIVFPNPAAICGRKDELIQGDESPSGISATCNRCRQIAHLPMVWSGRD